MELYKILGIRDTVNRMITVVIKIMKTLKCIIISKFDNNRITVELIRIGTQDITNTVADF